MNNDDPTELANQRAAEADELEQRSEKLESKVREVRADWERKRADDGVPGAPPPAGEKDAVDERESPAPESPPPSSGPGDAQTPSEGAAGPPADSREEG